MVEFVKLIIGLVVAITVSLIVWGALLPSGITGLVDVNSSLNINQTNPDPAFAGARSMNLLLATIAVLAILLAFIGIMLKSSGF